MIIYFLIKPEFSKRMQGYQGVYLLRNLKNGSRYIGSSQNLRIRFGQYFRVNHLESQNSMHINRALLKYDYLNFAARSAPQRY
jgi:excinuclease UvrABC nuclease subunit